MSEQNGDFRIVPMPERTRGGGATIAPTEPNKTPAVSNTQAAKPINYGVRGGQEGWIARTRARLAALGGVSELPLEQMTDQNIALGMERSRSALLEPGQTFTPRDVARWLNINPDKSKPEVNLRIGEFIGGQIKTGALQIVPGRPDEQFPRYTVINQEPILRAAHPQPVQQAKPR